MSSSGQCRLCSRCDAIRQVGLKARVLSGQTCLTAGKTIWYRTRPSCTRRSQGVSHLLSHATLESEALLSSLLLSLRVDSLIDRVSTS